MIKRLTVEDLTLIRDIMLNHFNGKIINDKTLEYFRNENNYLLGFIEDNKVVGILLAYILERCDGRNNMVYVHEVNVLKEYRKRGIGKKLINELKKVCEEKEYMKIFLITNNSNSPAVALYESTGGKLIGDDDVVYEFTSDVF